MGFFPFWLCYVTIVRVSMRNDEVKKKVQQVRGPCCDGDSIPRLLIARLLYSWRLEQASSSPESGLFLRRIEGFVGELGDRRVPNFSASAGGHRCTFEPIVVLDTQQLIPMPEARGGFG